MALCEKRLLIPGTFLLLMATKVVASEGYPVNPVIIFQDKNKQVIVSNKACFPVTVSVNQQSLMLEPKNEVALKEKTWTSWNWRPGRMGEMSEKTIIFPVKNRRQPDLGENVSPTHIDEYHYSYDFTVPVGSEIYAMEAGIVIRIVQSYKEAHQDLGRRNEVNRVEILHDDGSVAEYVHLSPESVKLNLCERVKRGQLIALTGNNGYSSVPHLHVDIFRPLPGGQFKTVPLKFHSK